MHNDSLLGFALLGLLRQEPQSGYDLRKVFATTAMGSFSDSPGAIYPALKRLETRGLVRGANEGSSGLRQRRVFRNTPKGLVALKKWLKQPVTRDDVVRGMENLMLRFAFMDTVLGEEHSARFLGQLAEHISEYIPGLRTYLDANASKMPLSGQLALECGIYGYEAQLKWARASLAKYEKRKRGRK